MAEVTSASGLIYEDTVVGEGAEAVAGAFVTVHYTGWLPATRPAWAGPCGWG